MGDKVTAWLYIEGEAGALGSGHVFRWPNMNMGEARSALLAAGFKPVDSTGEVVDEELGRESGS